MAVDLNQVVRDALEITESAWRLEPPRRGIHVQADGFQPQLLGAGCDVLPQVVPVGRPLQPHLQLVHAAGCVAGCAADGAGQLQGGLKVARHGFAIGINHHQDGFAAQRSRSAAVNLRIGALARFHRISRP